MKSILKKLIPRFLLDWYYWATAFFAAAYYGFPGRKMVLIGVTGTNGKSTTVDLIARILEKDNQLVASASSIRFRVAGKESLNTLKMTMPGRMMTQRFLREAVDAGCKYAVVEVTSEGIAQHRHKFINFDTAVLTNVTPEHIESHGGFENYRKAKSELFKSVKTMVVNGDDPSADYFLKFNAERKLVYKLSHKDSQLTIHDSQFKTIEAENTILGKNGTSFDVLGTRIGLNLFGEFNVQNAMAAICAAKAQGVKLETIKEALAEVQGEPGRMEIVIKDPFTVFVDYAHTPDALENVYKTLEVYRQQTIDNRQQTTAYEGGQRSAVDGRLSAVSSRLICVLGSAGGGRDKWKRPEMGKIAAQHCDEIILTDEDPYNENPSQILSEIKFGISNFAFRISKPNEILDRREAIRHALNIAKQDDVVIVTGKGCEPWMMVKDGRIPWDDRTVVREEYRKLKTVDPS
ncbi:MAG: UDP-N-acetylmuramoyl-L-alanyl-D-glutamate--2,6-diaminopimelate ligase [Candidatus Spechtbacteria bacterium]|nr:UDP-N-acetylmuramoyl-L-alanyl-D-glutamate--2,6-diaminopimelate ligase [Candidatus Spechtbacteria bacterium]